MIHKTNEWYINMGSSDPSSITQFIGVVHIAMLELENCPKLLCVSENLTNTHTGIRKNYSAPVTQSTRVGTYLVRIVPNLWEISKHSRTTLKMKGVVLFKVRLVHVCAQSIIYRKGPVV